MKKIVYVLLTLSIKIPLIGMEPKKTSPAINKMALAFLLCDELIETKQSKEGVQPQATIQKKDIRYSKHGYPYIIVENRRLYCCPECLKTFKKCNHVRRHLFRHWKIYPYGCAYCPRRTYECGNVKQHERRVHPGQPIRVLKFDFRTDPHYQQSGLEMTCQPQKIRMPANIGVLVKAGKALETSTTSHAPQSIPHKTQNIPYKGHETWHHCPFPGCTVRSRSTETLAQHIKIHYSIPS